ncbi:hypothetical protein [Candidatus Poriferisodalis sp.]|uniref:hypothetical protein n=1 Tax=Candidatus Poriferisodalis sp. TaxID=3101277 RepID=UPI003B527545
MRRHHGVGCEVTSLVIHESKLATQAGTASDSTCSSARTLAWLRDLMDRAGPGPFAAGVLLHTGRHALKLGDRLYLLPIGQLWTR